MQCECGNRAVLYRPYEGRALCQKHFLKSFEKKVRENIRKYNLIEHNDTLAIGLSGGKDSGALLHVINKYYGNRPDLDIFAILIDEGIHGYRDNSIEDAKAQCEAVNVPLHIYSYNDQNEITMDQIMQEGRNEGLSACHFCGVFRRDLLNKFTRELGATKIAVGHNLDDEVQAILMNYLKGDLSKLARLGFKSDNTVSASFVPRIKPFRSIPEREVGLYAVLNNVGADFEECPYAADAFRFEIRDFLNEMEDKHPTTKHSLLSMFGKLQPFIEEAYAAEETDRPALQNCNQCGEPCTGEVCRRCELLLRVKNQQVQEHTSAD